MYPLPLLALFFSPLTTALYMSVNPQTLSIQSNNPSSASFPTHTTNSEWPSLPLVITAEIGIEYEITQYGDSVDPARKTEIRQA